MWALIPARVYVAAACALALAVGIFALDRSAYRRGWKAAAAAQMQRDAETIDRALKRSHELEEAARAAERERGRVLTEVSSAYQEKLAAAAADNDRMRRDLARGAVRLRIPVAVGPADRPRGDAAAPAGPAAGCDGAAAGELPRATALDLWQLAADADRDAEQLAACQAVIRADRGK